MMSSSVNENASATIRRRRRSRGFARVARATRRWRRCVPRARARGRKRGRDDGVGASRTLVRFAGDGETADGGAEWIVRVDRDAFARVVACDAFVVRWRAGWGRKMG